MIELRPYSDQAAMIVLSRLDHHDLMEAEALRGQTMSHLALFAEWRAGQPVAVGSWVAHAGPLATDAPFAVLAVLHTGQPGVAMAGLLARDHGLWRAGLLSLGWTIRRDLPGFALSCGLNRIEARAWAGHPSARGFLRLCGFVDETPRGMAGFGPSGAETFHLFAWTRPEPAARSPVTPPAITTPDLIASLP